MSEDLDFGECTGIFHGVPAFSNIDDHFFSGEKHYLHGIYTGYKYQCVEYARRYLLHVKGCQFKECFRAAEIFAMDTVTNVETAEVRTFFSYPNGKATTKPAPGNILVYPWDPVKMPVGHVAVISAVGDDWVGIAEQNEGSKSWGANPFGRKLPLVLNAEDGSWTIQEEDPDFNQSSGWMMADFPDRPDPNAPLKPLPQFLTLKEEPAINRRRVARLSDKKKQTERSSWSYPHLNLESDAEKGVAAAIEAKGDFSLKEFKTVLYPNEDGGVGCIGCCNGSVRAVNSALQLIVGGFLAKSSDAGEIAQWLASRYDIPIEYAAEIKTSFDASQHGHGTSFASLQIGFTANTKEHKVIGVNCDTCENISFAAVFQQRLTEQNGHADGWSAGVKQDVARFAGKVCPGENDVLYFVDFGPANSLPAAVFGGDVVAERQYDVERSATIHLCALMQNGSEQKVKLIQVADLSVNGKDVVETATNCSLRKVHKTCTWATIFRMYRTSTLGDAASIIFSPKATEVSVYEPLFTAITPSRQFFKDVVEVLRTRDESKLTEAQIEVKDFLPSTGDEFAEAEFSDPGKYGPVSAVMHLQCRVFGRLGSGWSGELEVVSGDLQHSGTSSRRRTSKRASLKTTDGLSTRSEC